MPQSKGIRTRTNKDSLGLFDVDTEVKEYVRAIRANGGGIGLGAIYAVNEFVKGCKSDGVWDFLLDVGLFAGVDNLNAALVKLKNPSGVSRTYINNNFVSGDYLATGATAGLLCGSPKLLRTGFVPSDHVTDTSAGLFAYVSGLGTPGVSSCLLGSATNFTLNLFTLGWLDTGTREQGVLGAFAASFRATGSFSSWDGFLGVAVNGSRTQQYYRNGAAVGTTAEANQAIPAFESYIGALNIGGVASVYTSRRIRATFHTRGLSAAQVGALSARVNTLMAAFGASVY